MATENRNTANAEPHAPSRTDLEEIAPLIKQARAVAIYIQCDNAFDEQQAHEAAGAVVDSLSKAIGILQPEGVHHG